MPHQCVKRLGRFSFQQAVPLPAVAAHIDNIIPLAPLLNHFRNQFRGVLQVCIDDNRRVPVGMRNTCGQGRFFAEISGKLDYMN